VVDRCAILKCTSTEDGKLWGARVIPRECIPEDLAQEVLTWEATGTPCPEGLHDKCIRFMAHASPEGVAPRLLEEQESLASSSTHPFERM